MRTQAYYLTILALLLFGSGMNLRGSTPFTVLLSRTARTVV
jgi:hypothetical protein